MDIGQTDQSIYSLRKSGLNVVIIIYLKSILTSFLTVKVI